MAPKETAPCGSWKSPITSDLIVRGAVRLSEPSLAGTDVCWLESRPQEAGRSVVVRRTPDGSLTDLTSAPFNARTRVHEYGGGSYLFHDGALYFANFPDQRLYRLTGSADPVPLSPPCDIRFADFVPDPARSRLISVCEDHTGDSPYPENTVSALPLAGGTPLVLASGHDFYSNPRLSPDGTRVAFLAWDHPDMPWDANRLYVADLLPDGSLSSPVAVAGGPDESVFQPEWSPDGVLHFVSDRTGWWNLFRLRDGSPVPLCPLAAEFATPQWVFRMSTYAFVSTDRLLCTYASNGVWHLALVDTAAGNLTEVDSPFTHFSGLYADSSRAVFVAASPDHPASVVLLDLDTMKSTLLRRSTSVEVDPAYISAPEPLEFPTENALTAHALYYPPKNPSFKPSPGELPPLIVHSHGGPTSATSSALSLSTQFWTSRGFAVVDVNYGGSTGYGREYRNRLRGAWGVVDVDDCCNAARFLVKAGKADPRRLAIAGGSAGGYTTLCALAFRDVFSAGASYYGVSDAEALATDTHKFESRYLDSLIGPYPAARATYIERSPVYFTDSLSCPVIFLQGSEDKIVPPDQAERMFLALKERGIPVAYILFEGEQHGFRKAENQKRSLDAELYFYSRVFSFAPADPLEPVDIANLP